MNSIYIVQVNKYIAPYHVESLITYQTLEEKTEYYFWFEPGLNILHVGMYLLYLYLYLYTI